MPVTGSRISVQVSLSGFAFKVGTTGSGWLGPDRVFTTPELQRRYDEVEISLFTPKCALVPTPCFESAAARSILSDVVKLKEEDAVSWIDVPEFGAMLVYSNTIGESLSKVLSQTLFTSSGNRAEVLPELYYILRDLPLCKEYNKILASYHDGLLNLVIAQGKSLLLANTYDAVDFTTAEYFIFLAMKKLQLNPEVTTITFRTPLDTEDELSLYRYFKAVEQV